MYRVKFYSILLNKEVIRECFTFEEAAEIAIRNNGVILG